MSTVQVLLVSDVTKSDPLPDHPAKNICRRLFSDEDSAQRRAEFLHAVYEDVEKENRDRWNFDFRTGAPLPGRYQWVAHRSRQSGCPISKTTTQSKITDFLSHRKRHRSVESSVVPLKSRRLGQQQHQTIN